jgi:hypothetical protein
LIGSFQSLEALIMKLRALALVTVGLGHAFPAHGAGVAMQLDPAAIAQISPTTIQAPYGAPGFYPTLQVAGSNSSGVEPSRVVIEFALPVLGSPSDIAAASLGITKLGGSRGMGQLEYRIFGYAGTGSFTLDTGAAGSEIAGPFYYDIDISSSQNMSNLDVTQFVRDMVQAGATHVGFSLRDTNTPDNFYTDMQSIVVQDSPFWAGDVPPVLTLQVVPEPSSPLLAGVAATLLLRRRRYRRGAWDWPQP